MPLLIPPTYIEGQTTGRKLTHSNMPMFVHHSRAGRSRCGSATSTRPFGPGDGLRARQRTQPPAHVLQGPFAKALGSGDTALRADGRRPPRGDVRHGTHPGLAAACCVCSQCKPGLALIAKSLWWCASKHQKKLVFRPLTYLYFYGRWLVGAQRRRDAPVHGDNGRGAPCLGQYTRTGHWISCMTSFLIGCFPRPTRFAVRNIYLGHLLTASDV